MSGKRNGIGRRNFLKTVGTIGVASVLASTDVLRAEREANAAKEQRGT